MGPVEELPQPPVWRQSVFMTLPEKARSAGLGPKLTAGLGLMLAIAGILAAPTGGPIETLPARVSVPLPDWLIVAVIAALAAAGVDAGRAARRCDLLDRPSECAGRSAR